MSDNNESRRPGESWQAYNDRMVLQDQWHANARAEAALKARQDALIKSAQENLRKAVEADRKAGMTETATTLRTQAPRRDPILDAVEQWDWSESKKQEFQSKRRLAERAYYENIIAAEPRLLSDMDRKFLPAAILFFQREQAAQAAEGSK